MLPVNTIDIESSSSFHVKNQFNHILVNQSLARKRRDCPEPKAKDLPRPLGSQSVFARRNIRRKTPTAISRVNPAEV
jgi:hypothetical protein